MAKIHALTDVIGQPSAIMLTSGNVSEVKAAPALLSRAGRAACVLGDNGYLSDRDRRLARYAGANPVIPGWRNRKRASR